MISVWVKHAAGGIAILAMVMSLRLDAAAKNGSISVTATNKDGSPAVGIKVMVDKVGGDADSSSTDGVSNEKSTSRRLQEYKRIAVQNTDKEGKAEFKELPTATYRVAVFFANGRTRASQLVKLKSGESAKTTLKFKD